MVQDLNMDWVGLPVDTVSMARRCAYCNGFPGGAHKSSGCFGVGFDWRQCQGRIDEDRLMFARALPASLAIPSVFRATVWNSWLLCSGMCSL